jgi:hypothetical protein
MQLTIKIMLCLFLSIFLSACAVKYHAAEEGVSGFRDLQVEKNIFYVEYTEAARTSWEQIHQFTLKRCAEITKEKGYKFFDVVSKDEKTVYLETDVSQVSVASMGNLAGDAPVVNSYAVGGKVEGRRVTYRIQLTNE